MAENTENKNQTVVIVSVIAAIVAIVAICFCATLIFVIGSDKEDEQNAAATATPQQIVVTAQPTAAPVVTAQPAATAVPRVDLYNPNLTYKRMNEIHGSYLTNDETYSRIKDFILDFNVNCERYMNNGDTAVFSYMRPGTTAYNQQTDYKKNHPNLIQNYEFVDVVNTRTNGTYFYAWVHEGMHVVENGVEKNTVDHWVYKLTYDANGMYIVDYTKDPSYN